MKPLCGFVFRFPFCAFDVVEIGAIRPHEYYSLRKLTRMLVYLTLGVNQSLITCTIAAVLYSCVGVGGCCGIMIDRMMLRYRRVRLVAWNINCTSEFFVLTPILGCFTHCDANIGIHKPNGSSSNQNKHLRGTYFVQIYNNIGMYVIQ